MSEPNLTEGFSRRVGDRLRTIRRQKGLSLLEVETVSNQEFKASVLGAYERSERAISIPRLHRLACFYNVAIEQLLPAATVRDIVPDPTDESGPITIDLTRLDPMEGPEIDLLKRYLTMIQVQRQDFSGRVLTVRAQDRAALAVILGTDVDDVLSRLAALGLSYQP